MTRSALLGAILGFVVAFALGGCETHRSETPDPYADTLTQALLLDQGEEFQGPAPKAFDSGPCILEQNSERLQLGQAFYFRLMSLYSHDDVQYALVHVRGATKTLRVNGVLHGGMFPITGLLQGDETLRGKTFTIEITLVATKGAGPVVSFPLSILDSPPDTDNTTISALSAKGEQRFASGRAPGSVADGPHIENLQHPGLLAEHEAVVSITTFYDRDGQKSLSDITAVVMSVPTSQEYKEFPVKVTGEHRLRINVFPWKIYDARKTNLVLLALRTKDRVGTYYPFTFATEGGCYSGNTGDLYSDCSMLFGDCNEGWCDQATQCCVEWLCDNRNEAQLGGPCGGGGLFDGGESCFAGLYCNMATGCCEAISDGDTEIEGCPTLNCTGIFSHCPTGFVCDAAANCCVAEGTLDGDAERESLERETEGEAEGEPSSAALKRR